MMMTPATPTRTADSLPGLCRRICGKTLSNLELKCVVEMRILALQSCVTLI